MRILTNRRDEQGSMIVALAVIVVLSTLSVAIVARTLSGQDSSRRHSEFSAALAQADAGISDALYRVDQIGAGDVPASFCVGASAVCSAAALPGADDTAYVAERVDANRVRVRSKGTINGVPHGAEAMLVRSRLYPFALFGDAEIDINGNCNTPSCGVRTIDADGDPSNDPDADMGSNGNIICNGGSGPADHEIVYSGGAINGCPADDAIIANGEYNPRDPVSGCPATVTLPPTPCAPAGASCPTVGGILPASLAPGAYLCTASVKFPENTTFVVGAGAANGGVVEIFVIPSSGTATIDFERAQVNPGGDPTKLRVYMAGAGVVEPGNGGNAGSFTGILWAPSSDMTSNGCKAIWTGALVFNSARCNGAPHFEIRYDERVAGLVQSDWKVHDYKEIPSSQVVLP